METSPRFCLPQAPLWSLACAVATGREPFLCSLGGLTRPTFQASMGKAINLDAPFSKMEGHMDYQNLKRKSDHAKGGLFIVLFRSILCRAKGKKLY